MVLAPAWAPALTGCARRASELLLAGRFVVEAAAVVLAAELLRRALLGGRGSPASCLGWELEVVAYLERWLGHRRLLPEVVRVVERGLAALSCGRVAALGRDAAVQGVCDWLFP